MTGYNLFILRDDLTGFGIGGNKTRKLDFLMGDALKKKADTLVTLKATSFSRNAAFAANACGLELHVVVPDGIEKHNPKSRELFEQLDTKIHYVPEHGEISDFYNQLVVSLKNEGRSVYELHPGGSDPIGALGYVEAFNQIVKFSGNTGIHFSDIVLSIGSAGTQAGLVVGQLISGYETAITGITARLKKDEQFKMVKELVTATCRMLGIAPAGLKINLDDTFVGPGYAMPSAEGNEAAKAFACGEGILLDHAYTAKAAAALLAFAKKRMFRGENVLFIHTGGNSGLYY
jgi:1-aminocyclopropane-1-carboxylate deaminase/D-cysteine desulfhydrase-like pyridoxal-dependent ACC family enzyme